MTKSLIRTSVLGVLTVALLLGGGPVRADLVDPDPRASVDALSESNPSQASQQFELRSTIAFASNRHNPSGAGLAGDSTREKLFNSAEIYLMDGDGANQRRLTNNEYADSFPGLSPDGKKFVFDSNRLGHVEPRPTHSCPPPTLCTIVDNWDLFVMNADGSDQQHLTRGASSTWAPNGKYIAYHASKTGTLGLFKPSPSGAPVDSDIFVLNVDDCRKAIEQSLPLVDDCRKIPGEHWKNITNSPDVDDDPDWSPVLPDGTQAIVYTRHPVIENRPDNVLAPHARIYVMTVNPDGTPVQGSPENPNPRPLTFVIEDADPANDFEDRAPAWSADGTRIAFARRIRGGGLEIWVMNADGTNQVRLTNNNWLDATMSWSPDSTRIVFHSEPPTLGAELFSMRADGTDVTRLTATEGFNLTPNWGVLRVHVQAPTVTQPSTGTPAAAPVPKR
jgi:Tol biopolymer transport system component